MKLYLTIFATCISLMVLAQAEEASRRRNFNVENNVAIKGFDPVSYFKGKPIIGDPKTSYEYKGIIYYFATEANREEFKKSPPKFEPAYGGWCAYTVGKTGERVKMRPTTYKIINGKVYLFSDFNGDNKLPRWNADEKKLKAAADRNWKAKMH